MSEWQPIETAPKDGTEILACDGAAIGVVLYVDWAELNGPWRSAEDAGIRYTPTHWMPLPEPPVKP